MTVQEIAALDGVSFADLKLFAAANGLCITIVTPVPNPVEIPLRLKNLIRAVEKKLTDRRADPNTAAALVEPINNVTVAAEAERLWANSLILLRSPDVFRYYLLPNRLKEAFTVEDRFQVRPLLSVLAREQRFHLLGLSRQRIRLFECTQRRMDEINLEGVAPQDIRVWLNTRQPDHVLDNRSVAGPSVGSMKGVMFGTGGDRDRDDEYLSHFFKEVDKGIHSKLRNDTVPLVLAGVEYEVAIYRRVNTYPRLFEKAIHGSPDGLPAHVLHDQAKEIVSQSFSEPLQKALATFEKLRHEGRTSSDVKEVVRAAYDGRVADLFISEDADRRGIWDEQTREARTPPNGKEGEDILNAAALETVLHGGRAFSLRRQEMPDKAEVEASLRF